jgi:tetratricopeptide (TPR) repeat protein
MTGEIEAIVRSFAGQIASITGDLSRAERELRAAIDASNDSDSPVIDELRCHLAGVLVRQDRRDEAVLLLRDRAARDNPSAELLRTLARFLGRQPGDFSAEFGINEADDNPPERVEALNALRAAAEIRADPKRPMTLYNLATLLNWRSEDRAEAEAALAEAMETSRYYRRAWYTRRARGALHWSVGELALSEGDDEMAKTEFYEAARWYSAALRTRPHFRIWLPDPQLPVIHAFTRFRGSPVLHANAEDAHRQAGHRLRTLWHRLRAERLRRMRMKRGARFMAKEDWPSAYANYDFAIIGRVDDVEARAEVLRSVALQQMGETEAAARAFAMADERFAHVALIIRHVIHKEHGDELPYGVPDGGPMGEEEVVAELRRRGFGVDDD